MQAGDGEICAIRLTPDLTRNVGEPLLLFRASEAPWPASNPFAHASAPPRQYITDGPFLHRASTGELLMLWSSFSARGYALGVARSRSGGLAGPWEQDPEPLYDEDGGHGMLFRDFEGRMWLALHAPNRSPNERARLMPVHESGGRLVLAR